jgi:hypothetical protein
VIVATTSTGICIFAAKRQEAMDALVRTETRCIHELQIHEDDHPTAFFAGSLLILLLLSCVCGAVRRFRRIPMLRRDASRVAHRVTFNIDPVEQPSSAICSAGS